MSALAQTLSEYADELEEAAEGSGRTYLETLRGTCLVNLSDGQLVTIVNTVVNGQTTTGQISLSTADVLDAAAAALRELKGNAVKFTVPTFGNIPH